MTRERTFQLDKPRCAPWRMRPAFTLVELLVVVAIIGILVALLLPAVQSAREAARRAHCSNNLVQLIMAVHHYESTHHAYPPGTVNPAGPILNQTKGYHHGWIGQLMPFLEKEAIYNSINDNESVYHNSNKAVRVLDISWLSCASSPQRGKGYSNYAALHHDVESPIDVDQNGVFFLNSRVTQDAVSDGLGYTIFLGEKLLGTGDLGWMSGTRAILRNTGERLNTATRELRRTGNWNSVSPYPPGAESTKSAGKKSGASGSGIRQQYEPVELDDGQYGAIGGVGRSPRAALTFVGGFSSHHPGGANFAMGDGSTRFIIETVTMPIYRQLGHRADGELIDLE